MESEMEERVRAEEGEGGVVAEELIEEADASRSFSAMVEQRSQESGRRRRHHSN